VASSLSKSFHVQCTFNGPANVKVWAR